MSLVQLAEFKQLPRFQHMDEDTWLWIRANNPQFGLTGKPRLGDQLEMITPLGIDRQWFLEPLTTESLHGLRHLYRCAWYGLYVSSILHMSERSTVNLLVAALLHDIRRLDDKDDLNHATRAAEWLCNNVSRVGDYMQSTFSDEDVFAISTAIELHETPYQAFSPRQQARYCSFSLLVDALKTSDALDRYRLPKLKWWINDAHLRLKPPHWLKQAAFDIVMKTECDSTILDEPWRALSAADASLAV